MKSQQVMALVKKGISNKEISVLLGISNPLICYYKKQAGYVHIKKPVPISKTQKRLMRTGLSQEQLTSAIAKFIRKRANSKYTRHEFTITFDEIVWNTTCPILGSTLNYFTGIREANSVSFDRIDSSKGYVSGNVQIISWRANNLKSNGTIEEFEKLLTFLKNNDNVTTCNVKESVL